MLLLYNITRCRYRMLNIYFDRLLSDVRYFIYSLTYLCVTYPNPVSFLIPEIVWWVSRKSLITRIH